MTSMEIITLAERSVILMLQVSAPLLVIGLLVGLVIALFQATTQIHEMTLTFVPKILAVMLALLYFSSWMLMKLTDFTSTLIISIPDLIR